MQGDWVEIEVHNLMPFNSTIHAHGIHQTGTPWADGVPGLSQRPIPANGNYTYRWRADAYGSYFYHAHSRGQIDDGAYGPIVIRPQPGTEKPFGQIPGANVEELEAAEATVKPLIIGDWRHRPSEQTWADQIASGVETAICMDSLLVNGRGAVECLTREQIDANVDPEVAPILKSAGLQLTNKGCLPPAFFAITIGNSSKINPDAIPPEVFDICTPSYGSRAVFKAPSDKNWLALDIISSAGIATFAFSIDEHPIWVYAVDAHYIEPIKVDVLHVANGDRYSVFVPLDKDSGDYGIRIASLAATQIMATTAVLSYTGDYCPSSSLNSSQVVSTTSSIDLAGELTSPSLVMFNQSMMKSFPARFPQPPPEVSQTVFLHMGTVGNSFTWALNETPISHARLDNMGPPLLYDTPDAQRTGSNITIVTKNDTWVDLVFISEQRGAPPHPIHKHSNRGFILGAGEGPFNWTSVAEAAAALPHNFNLVTPPFRDGFVVPPTYDKPSWLAVRYHVINPGAFLLHCHIQSHLNGGMAMVMLDGIDSWPTVPDEHRN
ncbi:Cupredoxin [Phaeosphaeriaceae sp. SRC1lsM3a]|nr:Cupredoxin [Stagonospora sp. SRC1lsM3a]